MIFWRAPICMYYGFCRRNATAGQLPARSVWLFIFFVSSVRLLRLISRGHDNVLKFIYESVMDYTYVQNLGELLATCSCSAVSRMLTSLSSSVAQTEH